MLPVIHIGSIALPTYGLMVLLGSVAIFLVALTQRKKRHVAVEDLIYALLLGAVGAAIGAKLFYVLTILPRIDFSSLKPEDWRPLLELLILSGFVAYGGILGGLLAILAYAKKFKLKTASLLACFAVALPFGQACGRLGCHFAGCCYGFPYEGPLAVKMPQSALQPVAIERFPTQLAFVLGNLALGAFLLLLSAHLGRQKEASLKLIAAYMMGYALLRFLGEFLRVDLERGVYGLFSQAQLLSIPFFFAGLVLYLRAVRGRRRRRAA